MRSLPENHPQRWIQELVSKMQHKRHFNYPEPRLDPDWVFPVDADPNDNVERPYLPIYMSVPSYAKKAVKNWLGMESDERIPNAEKIKCYKSANEWAAKCCDKMKEFRKHVGEKGRNSGHYKDRSMIQVRWFQANIMQSLMIGYNQQFINLMQTNKTCKNCAHPEIEET